MTFSKTAATLLVVLSGGVALAGKPAWTCKDGTSGNSFCEDVTSIPSDSRPSFNVRVSVMTASGEGFTGVRHVDCEAWTGNLVTANGVKVSEKPTLIAPGTVTDTFMVMFCPSK